MEVLNLVLIYLQNLMHADVTIHKEETDQGARIKTCVFVCYFLL